MPLPGLVFVEDFHSRVLSHIMVPVEVLLQFIVGVERPLDVLDGTGEAEDLVLNQVDTLSP